MLIPQMKNIKPQFKNDYTTSQNTLDYNVLNYKKGYLTRHGYKTIPKMLIFLKLQPRYQS